MAKRKPRLVFDKIRYRVGKLTLRPQDILVVKTAMMLDKDQVRVLRDRAIEQSGHDKVIVLSGVDLAVLRKEKS